MVFVISTPIITPYIPIQYHSIHKTWIFVQNCHHLHVTQYVYEYYIEHYTICSKLILSVEWRYNVQQAFQIKNYPYIENSLSHHKPTKQNKKTIDEIL
jgi:hypothetical protein